MKYETKKTFKVKKKDFKSTKYAINIPITDDKWDTANHFTYQAMVNMMKEMQEMQKEKEENPENYCRICGKYNTKTSTYWGLHSDKTLLCEDCMIMHVKNMISKFNSEVMTACQKCFSHINACICEERKKLRELRK